MIGVIFCLQFLCGWAAADDSGEMEETEGAQGRFAFVNFTPDGSLTLTFNTTSLQYALFAAFTGLVMASIILPLLGLFSIANRNDPQYGYAYTDPSGYTQSAYDSTVSQALYSKRYTQESLNESSHKNPIVISLRQFMLTRAKSWMSAILESLAKSYDKYEEMEDNDIPDEHYSSL